MSRIPNFAGIDFADATAAAPTAAATPWLTPEGVAVKSAYDADDLAGLDGLDTFPASRLTCAAPTPPCT
jgi:methylmalonyl-CoA mutase